VGQISRMSMLRNAYKRLFRKSEAKRPFLRPRLREGLITRSQETECKGVEWIYLAQNRVQWGAFVHAAITLIS
jgi:hypothetical protein